MSKPTPAELLELYLLDELDADQRAEVERWLATDETATVELEKARRLLGLLDDVLTRPEDADSFCERTVAAAESGAQPGNVKPANSIAKRWRMVAAVAIVGALAWYVGSLLLGPSIEPPFRGPLPSVADRFAPGPWAVSASPGAEYESSEANQLSLTSGEVEVTSEQPCELVTPFAKAAGANVRFLAMCNPRSSLVRILVLAGQVSVKNENGVVKAGRGDLVIARQDDAPEKIAVRANNGFGLDLYRQLAESSSGNLIYSPYSAHSALAMAAAGARGETAAEMESVLHFPDAGRVRAADLDRTTWHASLFHAGAPRLMERMQRANDPALAPVRKHLDKLRDQLERQNARTKSLSENRAHSSFEAARRTADEINRLQDSIDHFELNVANGVWVDRSLPVRKEYARLIDDSYGVGEFRNVDFRGAPEQQRQTINQWVSAQTRGRIPSLLSGDDVTSATRMVLANAIYFRGDWQEPFRERNTKPQNFLLANGETQRVPIMHGFKEACRYGAVQGDGAWFKSPDFISGSQDDPANYPDRDGFLMAELPYENAGISMVILVPQNVLGLPNLEAKLNDEALASWIGRLQQRDMRVQMPRFEINGAHRLRDSLEALGMVRAFQPPGPDGADFSGIADAYEQLYIGEVVQKAMIEVNEKGTVAAAATGIVMETSAAAPRAEPFIPLVRADRPFLFLLRDMDSGAILFMGRVADPSSD